MHKKQRTFIKLSESPGNSWLFETELQALEDKASKERIQDICRKNGLEIECTKFTVNAITSDVHFYDDELIMTIDAHTPSSSPILAIARENAERANKADDENVVAHVWAYSNGKNFMYGSIKRSFGLSWVDLKKHIAEGRIYGYGPRLDSRLRFMYGDKVVESMVVCPGVL